jgi:multidrug resistance efflux pump
VSINIASPADAIVAEVSVGQGQKVRTGDVLFRLTFLQEPMALGRLETQLQLLNEVAYELTDDFIQKQRNILNKAIEVAKSYQKYVSTALQRVKDSDKPPQIILEQYRAEYTEASARVQELETNLETFEMDVAYRRREHAEQMTLVNSEIRALQTYLNNQTIKSPVDGTIDLCTGNGLFVKRGHSLAVVS